jgi:hypothetical protein
MSLKFEYLDFLFDTNLRCESGNWVLLTRKPKKSYASVPLIYPIVKEGKIFAICGCRENNTHPPP